MNNNMKLSSGARVSIKQAIRYQTGLNSGSVFDYYHRHYSHIHGDMKQMLSDKEVHEMYMSLGYTPKDLITLKKTFID